MEEVKQKYSTSTVLIVIIFLALFIVLPPMVRVLYPEDDIDQKDNNTNNQVIENTFTNGDLICTKTYQNAALEIVSTSTYEEGSIVSNTLAFSNSENIIDENSLTDDLAKADFKEYNLILTSFGELDATYKQENTGLTTITIDKTLVEANNNPNIKNQFQDYKAQQKYYEKNGFTCTTE